MKLNDWAKEQGINYLTAYRWFKKGLIPNSRQIETGTILVDKNNLVNQECDKVCIYCRVSSPSRKKELEYQVQRCIDFCTSRGYEITKIYKEVASGMNDKRRELHKLLDNSHMAIVVEHKDRFTRFGFNIFEKLLEKQNCKLIVINRDKEDETDLMKDLVSIITSFCCRLYGLRRGRNKTVKLKQVLNEK
jgi:predicted site-specific integrase-resolvase